VQKEALLAMFYFQVLIKETCCAQLTVNVLCYDTLIYSTFERNNKNQINWNKMFLSDVKFKESHSSWAKYRWF